MGIVYHFTIFLLKFLSLAIVFSAEEVKDEQTYRFLGDGYAVLHHDSSSAYNKYLLSVSLNFKTFDEDALLFLAVTNDTVRIPIALT